MAYQGEELQFFDFSGGLASNRPRTLLQSNQALELRNLIITPGKGIMKRQGDEAFNSVAIGSGTAVTGLGYYKTIADVDYLLAIAGDQIYKSDSLDGTFDVITGSVTITADKKYTWTFDQMKDLAIFVGGAPNVPIKWNGTGNAAALGGTPPNGNFGFSVNGRFFIGNTTAEPSKISWSALENPEDWTGTGSGSQYIQENDGNTLVGAAVLNNDVVMLFKENSIHKMMVRTSPFSVYPVFKGAGAVGKNAIVVANGSAYFITAQGKMKSTDGESIVDYGEDVDDLWSSIPVARYKYICGQYYEGDGFNHIIWSVSQDNNSTTNDLAIVWDVTNKCWLKHTTGYKCNVMAKTQNGILYGGHYNGFVYKKDVSGLYSDESETDTAIDGYWQSGWQVNGSLQTSMHPFKVNAVMETQETGYLDMYYGFDYNENLVKESLSMTVNAAKWDFFNWDEASWGATTDVVKSIFVKGRGNAFQVSFQNNVVDQTFKLHGFTVSGKKSAQKVFEAS